MTEQLLARLLAAVLVAAACAVATNNGSGSSDLDLIIRTFEEALCPPQHVKSPVSKPG